MASPTLLSNLPSHIARFSKLSPPDQSTQTFFRLESRLSGLFYGFSLSETVFATEGGFGPHSIAFSCACELAACVFGFRSMTADDDEVSTP